MLYFDHGNYGDYKCSSIQSQLYTKNIRNRAIFIWGDGPVQTRTGHRHFLQIIFGRVNTFSRISCGWAKTFFLRGGGIIIIIKKYKTQAVITIWWHILLSKYVEDNRYYLENAWIFMNIAPRRMCCTRMHKILLRIIFTIIHAIITLYYYAMCKLQI